MSEITRPFANVTISNDRRRYEIQQGDEGWFVYDNLAELHSQRQLQYSSYPQNYYNADTSAWVINRDAQVYREFGNHPVSHFLPMSLNDNIGNEKTEGMILRPHIKAMDVSAIESLCTMTCKYWSPVSKLWVSASGIAEADWDKQSSPDGIFTEVTQKYSYYEVAGTQYQLMARLTATQNDLFCPNLFFTAGIRRATLSEDELAWVDEMASGAGEEGENCPIWPSAIYFGGEAGSFEYALSIPVYGEPVLWRSNGAPDIGKEQLWWPVKFTGGQLSSVNPKSMAQYGATYSFGVVGNCIVVSEDGFAGGNTAYYRVLDKGQPIVSAGDVRIVNVPGQCTMWFAPMEFADTTNYDPYILRNPVELYGKYDASRINCLIYGDTLNTFNISDSIKWTTSPPIWWPLAQEIAKTFVGVETYNNIPIKTMAYSWLGPMWPPRSQAGVWPVEHPLFWPEDEAWPPLDTNGVVRDAMLETMAGSMDAKLTGGAVTLTYQPTGAGLDRLTWKIAVEPLVWTPSSGILTYSTPLVKGVSIWQTPTITDNGEPTYSALSYPTSISTEESMADGGGGGDYTVELDNWKENYAGIAPASLVRLGAQAKIEMGVSYDDASYDTTTLGDFVVVEIPRDNIGMSLQLADPLGMLSLLKWDGKPLNFQYWNSADAIEYMLNMAGYGADWYSLEDIGAILYGEWEYNAGARYSEIISDIASRGQRASVWYDLVTHKIMTGCKYCTTQRTSVDYLSHLDGGWNSTGCIAADVARAGAGGIDFQYFASTAYNAASLHMITKLSASTGALKDGEYANRVHVEGEQSYGGKPWLRYTDYDAIGPSGEIGSGYVGWIINEHVADDSLTSWFPVAQRMYELSDKFTVGGLRLTDFECPMNVALRRGLVIGISGGLNADTHNKKFRILTVRHDPKSAVTNITGRELK